MLFQSNVKWIINSTFNDNSVSRPLLVLLKFCIPFLHHKNWSRTNFQPLMLPSTCFLIVLDFTFFHYQFYLFMYSTIFYRKKYLKDRLYVKFPVNSILLARIGLEVKKSRKIERVIFFKKLIFLENLFFSFTRNL